MYISRRQSRIVAVATLVLFFLVGIWFTQKPTHAPSKRTDAHSEEPTTIKEDPNLLSPQSTPQESTASQQANPVTPEDPKTEGAPPSRFALEEFHRSETKDGKLIWEIYGTNARYTPENNSIAIDNCHLKYYSKENKQIDLTSGTALIFLSGVKLERAELRGDVTLVYDQEITVKTTEADFNKEENLVTSDQFVTISGDWYTFEGTGLHADLKTETVTLKTKVHSSIHPERRA
ncbi:MAG: LPS export ABC transporter periplasmic protein LptC [Bdellovibrionales bacterium]|nr:LPS export ABC transporter periplasmic protein LptC [Bdellovibrionales bacterium]